jgi:hypothetical protein
VAQELLAGTPVDEASAQPGETRNQRPLRLLAGIMIVLAGAAALAWLLYQVPGS